MASWPLTRYAPERRALAELFHALAATASGWTRATEPPPATAQSTHAQEALSSLDRSIEAERYRALLSQAERIRLSLLTLARLRARIRRESDTGLEVDVLDRCFAISSVLLKAIGNSLLAGKLVEEAPEHLRELV